MKLLSVNVSGPKEMTYRGQTVRTGIFKKPVPVASGFTDSTLKATRRWIFGCTAVPTRPSMLIRMSTTSTGRGN